MIYRCKDLGIFDERQIVNMYKQISYKKWRTVEPLDAGAKAIGFEDPILLRRIAELVFKSGRYSADELKSDLALSGSTLEQLLGLDKGYLTPRTDACWEPTLK